MKKEKAFGNGVRVTENLFEVIAKFHCQENFSSAMRTSVSSPSRPGIQNPNTRLKDGLVGFDKFGTSKFPTQMTDPSGVLSLVRNIRFAHPEFTQGPEMNKASAISTTEGGLGFEVSLGSSSP
ncbi:MAG: hypothetical protein AAB873_00330 [Patescibacteria group bacterium]